MMHCIIRCGKLKWDHDKETDVMLDKPSQSPTKSEPVVVKKYANRRLYNTETSAYVTLEDLGQMVRSDRDFVVFDAKSGDDLTHSVLTQIIVEQESRSSGPNLLPTPFLRQLIRFYDDMGVNKMVPGYLQVTMEALAREQERMRSQLANTWGGTTFEAYNEQLRKNMAMFEQAMRMWAPHGQSAGAAPTEAVDTGGVAASDTGSDEPGASGSAPEMAVQQRQESSELKELRTQLADMQRKIEELARAKG